MIEVWDYPSAWRAKCILTENALWISIFTFQLQLKEFKKTKFKYLFDDFPLPEQVSITIFPRGYKQPTLKNYLSRFVKNLFAANSQDNI